MDLLPSMLHTPLTAIALGQVQWLRRKLDNNAWQQHSLFLNLFIFFRLLALQVLALDN